MPDQDPTFRELREQRAQNAQHVHDATAPINEQIAKALAPARETATAFGEQVVKALAPARDVQRALAPGNDDTFRRLRELGKMPQPSVATPDTVAVTEPPRSGRPVREPRAPLRLAPAVTKPRRDRLAATSQVVSIIVGLTVLVPGALWLLGVL